MQQLAQWGVPLAGGAFIADAALLPRGLSLRTPEHEERLLAIFNRGRIGNRIALDFDRGIAREGLEFVCDRVFVARKPPEFCENFNASGSEFFTRTDSFGRNELDCLCVGRWGDERAACGDGCT
ncbi:MAG: hypothetical protein ACI8W3_002019 [Myxococcota bacterium]